MKIQQLIKRLKQKSPLPILAPVLVMSVWFSSAKTFGFELEEDPTNPSPVGVSRFYGSFASGSNSTNGRTPATEQNYGTSLNIPLAKNERDVYYLKVKYERTEIDSASLASSAAVPSSLSSADLSFGYKYRWQSRKQLRVTIGAGEQTDTLFAPGSELIGHAQGILVLPSGEKNEWHLSLTGKTERDTELWLPEYIPIPGIAYRWVVSDSLILTFGIPRGRLCARLAPGWTLKLAYSLSPSRFISSLSGRTDIQLGAGIYLFAAYSKKSEHYTLTSRTNDDDRFVTTRSEAGIGIGFRILPGAGIELGAGRVMGRRFEYRTIGVGSQSTVDVAPAWKGTAQLAVRF